MYIPKINRSEEDSCFKLIDAFPFATVLTQAPSKSSERPTSSYVSHLPLLREGRTLYGHLSRANEQARHLLEQRKAQAIFHGPHAYITPNWYEEYDVPTWNYAVAHVRGTVTLVEDESGLLEMLRKLAAHFEAGSPRPWNFGLPEDLQNGAVSRGILGFVLQIEELEGKFKLSQNRSAADRSAVREGLSLRSDEASRQVALLMEDEEKRLR